MKLNSIGKALGTTLSATAIAALTLTACGSDNNASTSSSSASGSATSAAAGDSSAKADCGGKNSVTAEGSTAQQLVRASVGARMLVVGTRKHVGLGRLIKGSVSHYCLSHARAPVVAVSATQASPEKRTVNRDVFATPGPLL